MPPRRHYSLNPWGQLLLAIAESFILTPKLSPIPCLVRFRLFPTLKEASSSLWDFPEWPPPSIPDHLVVRHARWKLLYTNYLPYSSHLQSYINVDADFCHQCSEGIFPPLFLLWPLLWLRDNYKKTFLELSILYLFHRFEADLVQPELGR